MTDDASVKNKKTLAILKLILLVIIIAGVPAFLYLKFGSEVFSRPGMYVLWVSANTEGLDNGYREKRILVMDPGSFSDALVMRVKGETDGSRVEAYLHQELQVTVEAPDGPYELKILEIKL